MFKKFLKELLLAAILTALLFFAGDLVGELLIPTSGEISLSTGLMVFSTALLILPALIGSAPSGFFIAKKTNDLKAVLFIPAIGAAIGGLILMILGAGSLLLMTDAAWTIQMAEAAKYGGDFFSKMSLEEYKALITFSVAFGAVFLALINFAIGLVGGFVGSKLSKK
ncbi:MAG: hypothetical protein QGI60_04220 [archaeon]|jgi:hypothetical protein|nr:hypothetical protein [archaeon]